MGNLGWLIAIANLCQVSTGDWDRSDADTYQLACQQSYVRCIEGERAKGAIDWEGPLVSCVKARVVESKKK